VGMGGRGGRRRKEEGKGRRREAREGGIAVRIMG